MANYAARSISKCESALKTFLTSNSDGKKGISIAQVCINFNIGRKSFYKFAAQHNINLKLFERPIKGRIGMAGPYRND